MMSNDTYQQKALADLDKLTAEVKDLMSEPDAEIKFFHDLEMLSAREDQLRQQLDTLSQAGGETRAALEAEIDQALAQLRQEFERLAAAVHQVEAGSKGFASGTSAEGHAHVDSIGWAQGTAKEKHVESIGWAQGTAKEAPHIKSKGWAEGYGKQE